MNILKKNGINGVVESPRHSGDATQAQWRHVTLESVDLLGST